MDRASVDPYAYPFSISMRSLSHSCQAAPPSLSISLLRVPGSAPASPILNTATPVWTAKPVCQTCLDSFSPDRITYTYLHLVLLVHLDRPSRVVARLQYISYMCLRLRPRGLSVKFNSGLFPKFHGERCTGARIGLCPHPPLPLRLAHAHALAATLVAATHLLLPPSRSTPHA